MGLLKKKDTGAWVDVPDADYDAAVKGGQYDAPDTTAVSVGPEGPLHRVSTETYRAQRQAVGPNVTVGSDVDLAGQEGKRLIDEDNSGGLPTLEAGALGAARGLTLHGSDWLLDRMGLVTYDRQRELQEAHPYVSAGGEIAGALAPALLSGGATAGESAAELGTEGVRGVASLAPTNLIARAGAGVQDLVGEGGAVRTALGRAAGGAVDNALYQGVSSLIDGTDGKDPNLTAERWFHDTLEAAALGGGLTLGGMGIAKLSRAGEEGYGGVRRMLGLGDAGAVDAMRRFDAPKFEATPYRPGPPPDLTPGTRGEAVYNGVGEYKADLARLVDKVQHSPGAWNPAQVENLRVLRDSYLPRLQDGTLPAEAQGTLLERLTLAETTAAQVSKKGLGADLPERWGQLQRQVRQNALKEINLAPDVSDRLRLSQNVGAHVDPTNLSGPGPSLRDHVAGQLNDAATSSNPLLSRVRDLVASKLPKPGKYAGALGLTLLGEEVGRRSAGGLGGSLASGLGGGFLKLQALRMAGKAARYVFEDPALAALGGATAAQVLHRATLGDGHDGTRKGSDPASTQAAMTDYVRRLQATSPAAAASHTLSKLQDAGVSPQVAFLASEAARRRQVQLQNSVPHFDTADPTRSPRYTEGQARDAAEVYRASTHPDWAFDLAVKGRLTPQALAAAEDVFPGTLSRIRSELVRGVSASGGPDAVPAEVLRTVRNLQGKSDRGEYGAAVAASVARGQAPPKPPAQPPAPTGGGPSGKGPFASKADRLGDL